MKPPKKGLKKKFNPIEAKTTMTKPQTLSIYAVQRVQIIQSS